MDRREGVGGPGEAQVEPAALVVEETVYVGMAPDDLRPEILEAQGE